MSYSLSISSNYLKPVFEAVALQALLGLFSMMNLDGGETARICGIALVAFWGGVSVLIWRDPQAPTRADIGFIRFGYLPVVVLAFVLVHFICHVRGVE
jgi:hypothetical protein